MANGSVPCQPSVQRCAHPPGRRPRPSLQPLTESREHASQRWEPDSLWAQLYTPIAMFIIRISERDMLYVDALPVALPCLALPCLALPCTLITGVRGHMLKFDLLTCVIYLLRFEEVKCTRQESTFLTFYQESTFLTFYKTPHISRENRKEVKNVQAAHRYRAKSHFKSRVHGTSGFQDAARLPRDLSSSRPVHGDSWF